MGQDPREMWQKLQQNMNQRAKGGLPGGPRNFFGGAAGLVLLGTGAVLVNNALFNGMKDDLLHNRSLIDIFSGWWSSSHQIHTHRRRTERDI